MSGQTFVGDADASKVREAMAAVSNDPPATLTNAKELHNKSYKVHKQFVESEAGKYSVLDRLKLYDSLVAWQKFVKALPVQWQAGLSSCWCIFHSGHVMAAPQTLETDSSQAAAFAGILLARLHCSGVDCDSALLASVEFCPFGVQLVMVAFLGSPPKPGPIRQGCQGPAGCQFQVANDEGSRRSICHGE